MKIRRILTMAAAVSLIGCTAPSRSRTTLESAGYSDIQIGGYSFFACGQDDHFSTKFVAKNPAGQEVSGTVCCGWLKSCTIRF